MEPVQKAELQQQGKDSRHLKLMAAEIHLFILMQTCVNARNVGAELRALKGYTLRSSLASLSLCLQASVSSIFQGKRTEAEKVGREMKTMHIVYKGDQSYGRR